MLYANKHVQHLYFTDLFNNMEMHIGSITVYNLILLKRKINCSKIQAIIKKV